MWRLFLCQFQRFDFPILENWHVFEICICLPVSGSPSPLRLCCSCLRLFGSLRKNTPLEFWSTYLVDFVIFNDFRAPQALCGCVSCLRRFGSLRKNTPLELWSMYLVHFVIFNDDRAPQALCGCVALPAALRLPQKKYPFGVLEYVLCECFRFCRF